MSRHEVHKYEHTHSAERWLIKTDKTERSTRHWSRWNHRVTDTFCNCIEDRTITIMCDQTHYSFYWNLSCLTFHKAKSVCFSHKLYDKAQICTEQWTTTLLPSKTFKTNRVMQIFMNLVYTDFSLITRPISIKNWTVTNCANIIHIC